MNNYLTLQEPQQFAFYRYPKAFFSEAEFQSLSTDAKLFYALFLNRLILSIQNDWIDAKNHVYIYYSTATVCKQLNCSLRKGKQVLKELEKFGLIQRKKQGFGRASRIYVMSFQTEKEQESSHLKYDYYSLEDAKSFLFYRIPKELFENPRYQLLSTDAKLLFSIMLDRLQLSSQNDWLDKEENAYFYLKMQEVCNLLNCCEKKSRQLFAELEKTGLIQRRRQHFGKPSCIYVMDFTESKEENGKNCTYGEQNPYQNGKNCTYEEQNLYQNGKNCTYEEQNLNQSGKNCTYEEQNLNQSGKNCTYEGQNLHLSAVNSAPVNRQNLHLNAVNSAPTDRQNLHSNKNNINNTDFSDIFMRDNEQQQELEPDVVVAKLRQSITIPFTDNDYFTLYRKADKNISLIQNLHDFLIRLEEAGLEVLEILLRNYQSCRILEKRDSVQEQYAPKPPESQQSILAKLKEFIHHSLTDKELLLLYQKANGNLALIREKYAVMQQQNVHNVMGFLLTAIKENYQPPQTNICRNYPRVQETKSEEDFLEEVYQEELQKMLDKVQFDKVLCDRENPYRFFSPDVLESLRGLAKLLVFEQEPDFFSKNSFYNVNQAATLAENLSYPLIEKVLDFYEKTDKENLLEVMFSYFFPQNQENQEKIKAEKLQAVFA